MTQQDKRILIAIAVCAALGFCVMPHLWGVAALAFAVWFVWFCIREAPK